MRLGPLQKGHQSASSHPHSLALSFSLSPSCPPPTTTPTTCPVGPTERNQLSANLEEGSHQNQTMLASGLRLSDFRTVKNKFLLLKPLSS